MISILHNNGDRERATVELHADVWVPDTILRAVTS